MAVQRARRRARREHNFDLRSNFYIALVIAIVTATIWAVPGSGSFSDHGSTIAGHRTSR